VIETHLSAELQYACKHWMVHLAHCSQPDRALVKELKTLCIEHLLHWVEVLSLLDELPLGLIGLSEVVEWCQASRPTCALRSIITPNIQKHSEVGELVASLLNDAERMVREFYPPVSSGALLVYESALEFMPKCELRTLGVKAKRSGVRLVSESYAQ
jgi:hypothetical protein